MEKLTQERLKELLHYDPKTGIFYRRKKSRRALVGDIAGHKSTDGYVRISLSCKMYYAHRLAFLYMEGYLPENYIDHIDRDPSNNSWGNLREASQSCNLKNRKLNSNNLSGVTGVHCRNKINTHKPWRAHISILGKITQLGRFATKEEAVKARWDAEVKYNYPNCNTTSTAYEYLKERNLI